MKVLILDGPNEGDIMDVNGPSFMVPVLGMNEVRQVQYHVHRWYLFGGTLNVASISAIKPPGGQAWRLVISDKAREAEVR
jgi:hypothetical protein